MTPLPGSPGPALLDLWQGLGERHREALLPHLLGGTSADWLSLTLLQYGHKISATSIRQYRRHLKEVGE